MTQYLEGATVYHPLERIDNTDSSRPDHAVAVCGKTGDPVEADPDDDELCSNCEDEANDA